MKCVGESIIPESIYSLYQLFPSIQSATRESYVDLVEKDELAPVYDGGAQESKPSLMEQSARLAKIEKINARARLDYDEPTRGPPIVSLRLKRSDDIPYEEDSETLPTAQTQSPAPTMAVNNSQEPVQVKREQIVKQEDTQMADVASSTTSGNTAAKAEQSQATPNATPAVSIAHANGTVVNSPAPVASTSSVSAPSSTPTQSTSKKRRVYAPRGKRLKSTLRQLVSNLKFKEYKPGKTMCEDFMDLPTKAELPEYYKEIKEPISMREIDEKSMRNGYDTAFSLFSDLRLMVKNAKEFNEESSEIWKNADAIGDHIENVMVPNLLAENFTLHPEDDRESVLPGEIFDPVAHAAAKAAELESSDESPEPSSSKRGKASNQAPNPNVHPNSNWQEYARANGYMAPNGMHANSPEAMRAQTNQRRMLNGQPMPTGYPPNAMSPPLPGAPHSGYPAGYPGASPFSGPPAVNGVSQHAPPKNTKRLNGEAPPDPYDIATLLLPDGTKWRRKSVCSAFTIAYRGVDGRDRDVIFANDVSHNHAVGIGSFYNSRAGENATVSIEFTLKKIIPVDNGKRTTEEDEMLQRPWSVTAHYNGILTKVQSADNVIEKDGATEVGQGEKCSIILKPTFGNSVLDISISPSAPDATLSAIVADPKHPHHSRATALSSLPDKYRIFLNCE